jgi:transposase
MTKSKLKPVSSIPPPKRPSAKLGDRPPASFPVVDEQPKPSSILVGIDWADQLHAFHLIGPDGAVASGSLEQSPEAIELWLIGLQKSYPDARLEVCLETSRGALINALLQYPMVTIYPVNPDALANYRKAFSHGGGKSDPVDAKLIVQYLQHYREQLRPLQIDQPLTRELASLCIDRRRLVQQRVKLSNELKSLLKIYFPAILLLKPAKLYAEFMVALLLKFSTLKDAQTAGPTKLRKLFFGIGVKAKAEARIETLMNAKPLTTDDVILRTSSRRARAICGQLQSINQAIKGYDQEIETLVKTHADYQTVASLPAGSSNTRARLIVALGDDRSRYGSAEALQCASGIAPLTTQSGKLRFVSGRWACSKFLRQTFHEYAGLSIAKCRWAKSFYESQLKKGKSSATAKRALAFKWIRIIYRLWQTNASYDEAKYEARLLATGSPLAMQPAAAV